MAAATTPEHIRPITRAEYARLIDAGMFQNERLELWKGQLVRMSPQKSPHASAIQALTKLLIRALGDRADTRVQLPFALSNVSEPEPDLAVVPTETYRTEHPSKALLIIEVADTSLAFDLNDKARGYAAAGIPEYWVVDVLSHRVTVMTEPSPTGYITRRIEEGSVSPLAFPDVQITVRDITG